MRRMCSCWKSVLIRYKTWYHETITSLFPCKCNYWITHAVRKVTQILCKYLYVWDHRDYALNPAAKMALYLYKMGQLWYSKTTWTPRHWLKNITYIPNCSIHNSVPYIISNCVLYIHHKHQFFPALSSLLMSKALASLQFLMHWIN